MKQASSPLWATVLAGGSGRRLAAITGGVPKQFCGFAGGRTLLADTLERIAPLARPARTSVVVDRAHERYLDGRCLRDTRILHQPCDRGTAAGVLFGLLPAIESAGDPIVLVTPSDHGVLDRGEFLKSIREAVTRVEAGGHGIVLFGAEPSDADGDYGWISPAASPRRVSEFLPVDSFVEKPPAHTAAKLFEKRAVWNTMVIVARLSVLLDLYRRHLPCLSHVFTRAQELSGLERAAFLDRHYEDLAVADFCRDVLTHADGLWVRIWPTAMGWSDLGTPERLRRWMVGAGQTEWITDRGIESEGSEGGNAAMQMEGVS